ncbi:MAG: hypothetical protein JOZ31_06765 [Verrucomicrobia bacterium]|nr:hypothetical protein [Verrucomicrobiota bacterium]
MNGWQFTVRSSPLRAYASANCELLTILLSPIAEEVLEELATFFLADTGGNQAAMV